MRLSARMVVMQGYMSRKVSRLRREISEIEEHIHWVKQYIKYDPYHQDQAPLKKQLKELTHDLEQAQSELTEQIEREHQPKAA